MSKKDIKENLLIPTENITHRIFLIRGQKVILSNDLAIFYNVETRVLIQAVKRNIERFPNDFMFQLNREEFENLKSQIVISSWGGIRRAFPYAFTEQGVAMLSSVLNSKEAIQINILIVRAFIKIREALSSSKELSEQIEEIKREQKLQNKYINSLYSMFEKLLDEPVKEKAPIGFSRE